MRLDFSELGDYFFDISNIFAVVQRASGKTEFIMQEPRPTDGLLLFSGTTGICYQKGVPPLLVPQGAMVYLPQGSCYIWENAPAPNSDMQEQLLFEFTLHVTGTFRGDTVKRELCRLEPTGERIAFGDHVSVVSVLHRALYKKLFYSLVEACHRPRSSPLSIFRAAYEIFDVLSGNCRMEKENGTGTRIVRDSIKFLEDDGESPKSIQEIAAAYNISIGYYERLFHGYTGLSPAEYRGLHRANCIKLLLQREEMGLDEIAEKMGCCDSGYLCRFFKKQTGMTPGEYRRIYLAQTQHIKPIP